MNIISSQLTRETLSNITDEGLFERLATNILRIEKPSFRGIIETGTNARGQTITDPADGISYVIVNGERWMILVSHTIARRNSLREKWLNPNEGDVFKAIQLFETASGQMNVHRRNLILTCSVEPSSDLVTDIEVAAANHNITIELWTGSRLAHTLDFSREGQWLRYRELKIPQQLLSYGLLKKITINTIENARPFDNPAEYIHRKIYEQLDNRFANNNGLVFIQGQSGTGKSVLCYNWVKRAAAQNGVCLLLNDEILANSITMEKAFEQMLNVHESGLDEINFQSAVLECSGASGVHLWVEDINRARAPIDLIRKLLQWKITYSGRDEDNKYINSHIKILCPLRTEHIQAMTESERKEIYKASLYVTNYNPNEATCAVMKRVKSQKNMFTKLQASEVAKSLNYDPLLIGLVTDWKNIDTTSVIKTYVNDSLARLAGDGQFRKLEYRQCLLLLSDYMLKNHTLAPTFDKVMLVMRQSDYEKCFRHLINDGTIINADRNDRLRFRHSRVRDFILAEYVSELIENKVSISKILQDPFLAEVIGMAVFDQGSKTDVAKLCDAISPLAVFHAFAKAVRTKSELEQFFFKACKKQFTSSKFRVGPKSQIYAIQSVLAQLDGANVRELLEKIGEKNTITEEGLARNGCVRSAAAFCYYHEPYITSLRRDALLSHLQSTKGEPWVSEIATYLTTFKGSKELEEGALFLAGEIGEAKLISPLKIRWDAHVATGRMLSPGMLYAVIRCAAGHDDAFADKVVQSWVRLPEQDDDRKFSNPRYDVSYSGLSGVRRDPSDRIVKYLLALPQRYSKLIHPLSGILGYIDHPDVVRYIAEAVAKMDHKCESEGKFNLWGTHFADYWGRMQNAQQMSDRSRVALKSEWQNPDNDIWVRRRSFDLWSARLKSEDIDALSSSPPSGLEDRALHARLVNGDKNAKGELADKILNEENNLRWIQLIRHVDTLGLEDVLRKLFAKRQKFFETYPEGYFQADDILLEILGDRDDEFALELILENWGQVQYREKYAVALLYFATSKSLEAASETINQSSTPQKILELYYLKFGIKTLGRAGIKRIEQIEAIAPYFHYLSDRVKQNLWETCNDRDWLEWRRQHLDQLVSSSEDRVFSGIDEANDFCWLDKELIRDSEFKGDIFFWAESRIRAGIPTDKLVKRAARYSSDRCSPGAYRFLCNIIAKYGKRSDCLLLDSEWIQGNDELQIERENTIYSVHLRTFE